MQKVPSVSFDNATNGSTLLHRKENYKQKPTDNSKSVNLSNRASTSSKRNSRLEVEEEVDMLLSFCRHKEKVLLSAGWAVSITHVGQKFEGGIVEFRNALSMFSIECGFEFIFVKNDKVRVTAQCLFRETKGCMWNVHGRVENANGFFYIRKLNNVHTCGAEVRTMNHSRMSSNLVVDLIAEGVRDNPLTCPVHVVRDFKLGYGLRVSYCQAWLGVEKAKCEIFGDYLMSFDQLRWYVDIAKSCNPRSYIEFECDDDTKRFKRLFVFFHGSISGFDYCRPLLFIDGTFLKRRFRGNLLAATGKDGNQGFFLVCFVVVGSKNQDNWHWFLEHLSTIVSPEQNITFVSDRNLGLVEEIEKVLIVGSKNQDNWHWFLEHLSTIVSLERNITFVSDRNLGLVEVLPKVFLMAFHAYCLYHLKMNLRHHLRGMFHGLKEKLITLFGKCAYAPIEETFHQCLVELKTEGRSRVEKFLDDIPYDHWSNAYFRGQRFGEMWSNVAESFNSWI
ncbi:uncharacterized protein LOC114313866 [Camellia sinensis]|uniref:uncharacterized protein LOC114313866 n=1 Tax=Camellia sinensis TaxID=4442 RepID=UPI00103599F8|nr:uncharacterized protein LOC114313866 [Camellia sinensis]